MEEEVLWIFQEAPEGGVWGGELRKALWGGGEGRGLETFCLRTWDSKKSQKYLVEDNVCLLLARDLVRLLSY